MMTPRELITFIVVAGGCLTFVSFLLASRARAGGQDPVLVGKRIAVIWVCAIGAAGCGIGARFATGGGVDLGQPGVEPERLWPAAGALLVIFALLAVAMRQVRLLTSDAPPTPEKQEPSDG
jgi:hypothetical protein